MAVLLASTLRRLQKLPRTSAIWEGDCRPLPAHLENATMVPPCLLWVDSSAEMVRTMLFVEAIATHEAFVQGLVQAMERPQAPATPGLPVKILVRDRALQLFLQEVLADLAIRVEYAAYLPLLDELFANLCLPADSAPSPLPDACATVMQAQVAALQQLAPWDTVPPWRVVELTLGLPSGTETLYATVVRDDEQGVLFFRSAADLLSHYDRLATVASWAELAAVFQQQNCWFVMLEEEEKGARAVHCGSRHPLEGERRQLDEAESMVLAAAVAGAVAFWRTWSDLLPTAEPPASLDTVLSVGAETVSVQARPAMALEAALRERLRPLEAPADRLAVQTLVTLQEMPRSQMEVLRGSRRCRQQRDSFPLSLPLLLLHMPRDRAEAAILTIADGGGLLGLGFYRLPDSGRYVGVLVMANGQRFCAETLPQETSQILRWQRTAIRSGYTCAVAIAVGSWRRHRHSPELRQILAYYEVELLRLADSEARWPVSL